MRYAGFINWLSTTRFGIVLARGWSARADPWIYRLTGGRLTSVGPQVIPQLILTTTGRRSGQPRTVQLGCLDEGESWLVVASNFGRANHPAWSLNLDAQVRAEIQWGSRRVGVVAERLGDEDKALVWPHLVAVVPQFSVYVNRTERNLKVYRLRPVDGSSDR